MASDTITTNIVGQHFRPPAKALLAIIPAGHPLLLQPEPTNEYDENAVQVVLRTTSLEALMADEAWRDNAEMELSGQGHSLETIFEQDEWQLGYLPKVAKGNPALQEWNVGVQRAIHQVCAEEVSDYENEQSPAQVQCSLSFDGSGKPVAIVPWPPTASTPAGGPSSTELDHIDEPDPHPTDGPDKA